MINQMKETDYARCYECIRVTKKKCPPAISIIRKELLRDMNLLLLLLLLLIDSTRLLFRRFCKIKIKCLMRSCIDGSSLPASRMILGSVSVNYKVALCLEKNSFFEIEIQIRRNQTSRAYQSRDSK